MPLENGHYRISYTRSIVSHVTVTTTATLCAYYVNVASSSYPHPKASMIDRLNALGLRTRATPKLPSKEITKSKLEAILKNPYYAGIVRYDGVNYDGAHEPIISLDLFDNVQTVLHARINGNRSYKHDHFLKGFLFCKQCGSRMLLTNAKSCSGNIYPYFICAGRHRTKYKDKICDMKAILIDAVEYQMEKIFEQITISPSDRILIEQQLQSSIDKEEEKFNHNNSDF